MKSSFGGVHRQFTPRTFLPPHSKTSNVARSAAQYVWRHELEADPRKMGRKREREGGRGREEKHKTVLPGVREDPSQGRLELLAMPRRAGDSRRS